MANPHKPPVERFWMKVSKTDTCWLWTGTLVNKSYGYFRVDGRDILSHRYSYLIHKGDIQNGLLVCHTCDVPACVNPDHLWLGTAADNMRDRFEKGRYKGAGLFTVGEDRWNAKLTWEKVAEIRAFYQPGKKGHSINSIAKIHNINYKTAWRIIKNVSWKI